MKNTALLTALLILISFGNVFSQHLFDEKSDGCITDQFVFEKDSMIIVMNDSMLVSKLTANFDEDIKKEIRGTLTLQVFVNMAGHSCLLSLKNELNVKTDKLHLKKSINEGLLWNKPEQSVSVILLLRFEKDLMLIRRLGLNGNGLTEIKK